MRGGSTVADLLVPGRLLGSVGGAVLLTKGREAFFPNGAAEADRPTFWQCQGVSGSEVSSM
jgi:hypothetical protein